MKQSNLQLTPVMKQAISTSLLLLVMSLGAAGQLPQNDPFHLRLERDWADVMRDRKPQPRPVHVVEIRGSLSETAAAQVQVEGLQTYPDGRVFQIEPRTSVLPATLFVDAGCDLELRITSESGAFRVLVLYEYQDTVKSLIRTEGNAAISTTFRLRARK